MRHPDLEVGTVMTLFRMYVTLMVIVAVEVGWLYGSVQWGLW